MVDPSTAELSATHRAELLEQSSISADVVRERGYQTLNRPNRVDPSHPSDTRTMLNRLGFPTWATREDYYFPGLWVPQYTPAGQKYAGQWKPFRAVPNRDGKPQRYTSAKGPSRLDVHPRWSVLGGELLPPILDPARRLWITEGVKKADSLTSRGEVTVALAGVYNWRNGHATLGDWEDVALKGREIVVCFDADAITKPAVSGAMARLGKWLRYKGARKVWFLVVPPGVNGKATKGVDDFFAAGGQLKELEQAFDTRAPEVVDLSDRWTDSRLAETLSDEVLDGSYIWMGGLGWMSFNGQVWREVTEVTATESVRRWALDHHGEAAAKLKLDDKAAGGEVDGWRSMLSANRARTVLSFSRGLIEHSTDDLDTDRDYLNTPTGYVNLETGEVRQVGADEYPTKLTGAHFDPDARSEIWETFLERILPDAEVRAFVQRLFGYSLLGEVREHILPIFIGEGANGKGTLRDAVMSALGDYALEVDPELLMSSHNPRHKTFILELMGRRLVFCSETDKNRCFNEAETKRLVGGDPLQGNRMKKDPVTFIPSHTLIMCTNHLPKVGGDDPAVWRRLLVVPFDVVIPLEERDNRLPRRLQEPDVQRAVLAWAMSGLADYLADGLRPPVAVQRRTEGYRQESDMVGRFLADRTEQAPAGRTTTSALFEAYASWFRAEASREDVPLSKAELTKEITKRGYATTRSNGSTLIKSLAIVGPDVA